MFHRFLSVLALLGAFAACTPAGTVQGDPRQDIARDYRLAGVNFSALADLTISEENSIYPQADIVWHGDAPGDRIAQIAAMFQEAAARNIVATRAGDRPVALDITLVRFHGVTRRAEFSTGGVHHIVFDLTVRDADIGTVIEPKRRVVANLEAWGGNINAQLDAQGATQKLRVTDFLTSVLADQLR
ncbi:MAG: hypothetical protein O2994_04550 [Proteobacteria bacterium]|nr:hypothetical protein [Pseudomonadota bacterium]MDA1153645.1 hypothetical protein [Pseudomonadota bacterium]